MTDPQPKVARKRRQYNKLVATESIEDYALRYSPTSFRKWTEASIANTALGSISFLALEAIGAGIAIHYGFMNAFWGILVASIIIFLTGIPISYYTSKYNIDMDLLTRASGFGYFGSTITSLIYASFSFIFFALEAAILAQALYLYTDLPLYLGYALCSVVIIPLTFYGFSFITKLQLWTQPFWLVLMIAPFIIVLLKHPSSVDQFISFVGTKSESNTFSIYYFGFALGISLSLIAQIGEQVDYLRFMPDKTKKNNFKWWLAVIFAGPGWIILGFLKQIGGIFLASLVISTGASLINAKEPIHMYNEGFKYVFDNINTALAVSFIFVVISQIKINVTNAYAGSLAWSNFFSRTTHTHPGRVVWLVLNIAIALLLMEIGLFEVLENILGLYSNVAIAWIASVVADLVINKPLGLRPNIIEFKRAHLFNINPVGVYSMFIASVISIVAFSGLLGEMLQAFSSLLALCISFILTPIMAFLTKGKYYIARTPFDFSPQADSVCSICEIEYQVADMAYCPMYDSPICSLCCTLESRCKEQCKPALEFSLSNKILAFFQKTLSPYIVESNIKRLASFSFFYTIYLLAFGSILLVIYHTNDYQQTGAVIESVVDTYFSIFYMFSILGLIGIWMLVLLHESRDFVESELNQINKKLEQEINERKHTEKSINTLVKSMSGLTGQDYFDNVVKNVSEWFKADAASISIVASKDLMSASSFILDGKLINDYEYQISGSPCEKVIQSGKSVFFRSSRMSNIFRRPGTTRNESKCLFSSANY